MHTVYDKALEIAALSMEKIGENIMDEELELYRRTRALASIMADGSIEETIRYIEMGRVIEADVVDVEYEGDKVILVLDEGAGAVEESEPEPEPEPEPAAEQEAEAETPEDGEEKTEETKEDGEAETEPAAEEDDEESETEKVGAHAKKPEPEIRGGYRRVEAASPATLAGRDIAETVAKAKGRRAIITIGTSAKYSLTNRLLKELRGKVVAIELL